MALRAPFVNNRIDPALFDPIALKVVAKLPKVTGNECGEITYGARNTENETQWLSKIDYQASDKHSLFGRFLFSGYNNPRDYDPDNIFTAGGQQKAKSYAFTTGSTYLDQAYAKRS